MPAIPPHRRAARLLESRGLGGARLAIVLGSGFRSVAEAVVEDAGVGYSLVPGFREPGVHGHAGRVIRGLLGGAPVLVLSGRVHHYEGLSLGDVTFPMRALAELGVECVLLTNAAGGIHRRFKPGDFMVLEDHINFMGANPLRGVSGSGGERFVDMTSCYDAGLRAQLVRAARLEGLTLRRGVYLAVSGPSYETPAEIRMFERWGADAVGMSTVPEAVVARQCGMRVAGLSLITNLAAGRAAKLSHGDVLEQAAGAGERMRRLLERFARLHEETPAI